MVDPRLVAAVGALIQARAGDDHVPIIGISGAQGSGKSTLAAAAAEVFGAVRLSLDDFYLSGSRRWALAAEVHPLFVTRGPPCTHDLEVLQSTLDALMRAEPDAILALPAFDKLADEPAEARSWRGRPRAVLVEGWCLGARPQTEEELDNPVNSLEREEDVGGRWRRAVNAALDGPYRRLFDRFDGLLYLRAPSFQPVLDWRCEQEEGLLGLSPGALPAWRRRDIGRFIQHFERLTRQMMAGGVKADRTAQLDAKRGVGHIG